jgi:cytochrome c-type biogenesis protein CcmH
MRPCLAAALLVLASSAAHAVQPDEILSDPALEARARELSAGLRCLVCQNQSIDDSDAPLAKDLRVLVRERLKAGASDAEVRDYIVDRYGEYVLLEPPLSARTLMLWLMPAFALALAVWAAARVFASAPIPTGGSGGKLSSEEEARLKTILGETSPDGKSR